MAPRVNFFPVPGQMMDWENLSTKRIFEEAYVFLIRKKEKRGENPKWKLLSMSWVFSKQQCKIHARRPFQDTGRRWHKILSE